MNESNDAILMLFIEGDWPFDFSVLTDFVNWIRDQDVCCPTDLIGLQPIKELSGNLIDCPMANCSYFIGEHRSKRI